MARTEIPIVVIDPATGNAVSGASVTVVNRATSSNATIYAGETGATTAANPRTTDANGRLTGWVERGPYRLDITGGSLTPYSKNWDSAPAANSSVDNPWLSQAAAWTAYTPTWTGASTNPTYATHTVTAAYQQIGRTMNFRLRILFGASNYGTGGWYIFGLPAAASTAASASWTFMAGAASVYDSSANVHTIVSVAYTDASSVFLRYGTASLVSPTTPYTLASGDIISINGTYEAAA